MRYRYILCLTVFSLTFFTSSVFGQGSDVLKPCPPLSREEFSARERSSVLSKFFEKIFGSRKTIIPRTEPRVIQEEQIANGIIRVEDDILTDSAGRAEEICKEKLKEQADEWRIRCENTGGELVLRSPTFFTPRTDDNNERRIKSYHYMCQQSGYCIIRKQVQV